MEEYAPHQLPHQVDQYMISSRVLAIIVLLSGPAETLKSTTLCLQGVQALLLLYISPSLTEHVLLNTVLQKRT